MKNQKHYCTVFIALVLAQLLNSCATIPPSISDFAAAPSKINAGESATLHWKISDCKDCLIHIESDDKKINHEVTSLVGSLEVTPDKTMAYVLHVKKDGATPIQKSAVVMVAVPPQKEKLPPPVPIVEKRNDTKSDYLKGTINFENISNHDKLNLVVNNVDISNYPKTVKLYCTVKDENGNHVANLAPPYNYGKSSFWSSVVESFKNKNETIASFTVEEVRSQSASAFSSVLVADYSGSMASDIQYLEEALKTSVAYLRQSKDFYTVVQFDHRVFPSIELNSDPAMINGLTPFSQLGGGTAFYSGAVLGINLLSGVNTAKVAILFTDGMDNASIMENANDVISKSRKENMRVFVIGYSGANMDILNSIALQTGGRAYFPTSSSDLPAIFAEIYQFLNVHYIVTYTSDGDKNKKNVRLTVSPSPNTKISSETTYYPESELINEAKIFDIAWFKPNSSKIDENSNQNVQFLIEYLQNNPDKRIEIYAHTDSRGSHEANLMLSKKRVRSFVSLLTKNGVNPKQILKYDGKGKKELIHKNDKDSPWMQQENRRCEIKLI